MSVQRECLFQKCSNGKWYLFLADQEYGEFDDCTCYGPFNDEKAVQDELNCHSNPGCYSVDNSGTKEPPKVSPNGRPLVKSSRMSWNFPRLRY